LYQAITGGVSWKEIVDMPDVEGFSTMVVILYVAFVLFAIMNIVTGLFLASALASAKRDNNQFLTRVALKIFQQADKKATGIVTWKEFEECLAYDEVRMHFDALGLDVEEAKKLFMLLDKERSGQISFDDFILGSVRLHGPARALDLAVIGDAFRNWSDHAEILSHRIDLLEQRHIETLSSRMDFDLLELEKAGVSVKEANPINAYSLADTLADTLAESGEGSDSDVHKTHADGLLEDASVPCPLPPVFGSDVNFGPLTLPEKPPCVRNL